MKTGFKKPASKPSKKPLDKTQEKEIDNIVSCTKSHLTNSNTWIKSLNVKKGKNSLKSSTKKETQNQNKIKYGPLIIKYKNKFSKKFDYNDIYKLFDKEGIQYTEDKIKIACRNLIQKGTIKRDYWKGPMSFT